MDLTDHERECIRIANLTYGVRQATRAAEEFAQHMQDASVRCADCEVPHRAVLLDLSTGLCPTCEEFAGHYNAWQDGQLTERELLEIAADIDYKGKDA